ncbi:MAG TPA: hypothetical protein VGD16_02560 [Enterovirga sp.]|jgi:cytochrome c-type biogenesis protein CcmE
MNDKKRSNVILVAVAALVLVVGFVLYQFARTGEVVPNSGSPDATKADQRR